MFKFMGSWSVVAPPVAGLEHLAGVFPMNVLGFVRFD